jgi:hypothetical protein
MGMLTVPRPAAARRRRKASRSAAPWRNLISREASLEGVMRWERTNAGVT